MTRVWPWIGAAVCLWGSCALFPGPPEEPPATAAQRANHEGLERLARFDLDGARHAFEQALAQAEMLDDLVSQAEAWNNLAELEGILRDLRVATAAEGIRSKHERALALHREAGNAAGEARTLRSLGSVDLAQREWASARSRFEEALRLATRDGDAYGVDAARLGMAAASIAAGDAAAALGALDDVIARRRQDGDRELLAAALANRGDALATLERWADARAAYLAALAEDRRRDAPLEVARGLAALTRVALAAGDGQEAFLYALREGRVRLRLGDRAGAREALERVRASHGEVGVAARTEWDRLWALAEP